MDSFGIITKFYGLNKNNFRTKSSTCQKQYAKYNELLNDMPKSKQTHLTRQIFSVVQCVPQKKNGKKGKE